MGNDLFLHLAQRRVFWRLRSLYHAARFSLSRESFAVRCGLRETGASAHTLLDLARVTLPQLTLGLVVSAALQLIDPYLAHFYPFDRWSIPDSEDYVTYLATIAGMGGVFIGLYYAAVSAVGSAIYSRVPNDVRELLAREQVGNVYMSYLSFLTFSALSVVGFRVFGLAPVHLAVPVFTVLAGVGVVAFVKLGQRAFYLFDPTRLSHAIFRDLYGWVKQVEAGAYRWDDPSFQNHARKQASSALQTLKTLADISEHEPHLSARPFAGLATSVLLFLINYRRPKKTIPSQSRWYATKYVHRDWYRTGDTTVSIHHRTGTALEPELAPNMNWLEDLCFPIVVRFLQSNLKRETLDVAAEAFSHVNAYLRTLAEQGEVNDAFAALEKIGEAVQSTLSDRGSRDAQSRELPELLGLTDYAGGLPVTILLAYAEATRETNRREISKRLSRVRWRRLPDVYTHGFQVYLLPRLEWLQRCLHFEISAEGRVVTPLWYQAEQISQVEAEKLAENAAKLLQHGFLYFERWTTQLETAKRPWLFAAVLSREWEYWHRAHHRMQQLEQTWKGLSDERHLQDLPWPQFDIKKWEAQLASQQIEILKKMAKQSSVLALLERPKDFPDYSGQFLHTVGEAVFDALLSGNTDMVKALFIPYFFGCIKRFDDLKPTKDLTDWRAQQELHVALAPLLDLMDLSGYARLLADFHNKAELWTQVKDVWDEYLDGTQGAQRAALLAAGVSLTEGTFAIPHRGLLRTGWQQRIDRTLNQLPRREIYIGSVLVSDTLVLHPSSLVRLFARDPFMGHYDGLDVFIGLYLGKREGVDSTQLGRKHRDLEDALARETRFYDEHGADSGVENQ